LLSILLILLSGVAGPLAADSFVVIVNDTEPVSSLSPQEVSNLFLRKLAKWPDGTNVVPVDLDEGSPARVSFSRSVHGKNVGAIKAYWQKMIFSGRAIPPPEKRSPAEVVAFVRSQRGAIGYVPQGTPLGPGIKTLTLAP